MKKGFTLIELILVISLMMLLGTMGTAFTARFLSQNAVGNARDQLSNDFKKAQLNAMMGKQNSNWGVNYASNTITLYKGASYATRTTALDETFSVYSSINITGFTDINFARATGLPNTTATITIAGNGSSQTIQVNGSGSGPSSVTLDATSSSANTASNVGTFSWTHVTGSQSNMYMVVGMYLSRQGATITAPTYNGVSMTLLGTVNLNTNIAEAYIYGLASPASGSHTVSFSSVSPTSEYAATAATFYNVSSVGTPVSNTNGNVASTSPNTGAITTIVGGVVYDVMQSMVASGTITATSPQTAILIEAPSTALGGGFSYQPATTTSTTNSWTTSSGIFANIGVALRP